MDNPYSLYDNHKDCEKATKEMDLILQTFENELKIWQVQYQKAGARDTAVRDILFSKIREFRLY